MTDLSIVVIKEPTIIKSGTSGAMHSEIKYSININTNVGQQVEYRARIFDSKTFQLLGQNKRFITINPNDQFPSRSMNILYANYDSHPKVIVDFQMIKGSQAISNAVSFTLDLFDEPINPPNTFFTINYIDGSVSSQIVSNDDFIIISNIQNDNFFVSNVNLTIESPTKTLQQVLDDIQSHEPTPPPDETITTDMISQSIGFFKLKDNRILGEILYIAESKFNPFFYNKELVSIVVIRNENGDQLTIKPNSLFFTETERDERIFIDESAFDLKKVIIDFFVWDSLNNQKPFTLKKSITLEEGKPPDPVLDEGDNDLLTKIAVGLMVGVVGSSILGGKK